MVFKTQEIERHEDGFEPIQGQTEYSINYHKQIEGTIQEYPWTHVVARDIEEAKIKAYIKIKKHNKKFKQFFRFSMDSIEFYDIGFKATLHPIEYMDIGYYAFKVKVRYTPEFSRYLKNYIPGTIKY